MKKGLDKRGSSKTRGVFPTKLQRGQVMDKAASQPLYLYILLVPDVYIEYKIKFA